VRHTDRADFLDEVGPVFFDAVSNRGRFRFPPHRLWPNSPPPPAVRRATLCQKACVSLGVTAAEWQRRS